MTIHHFTTFIQAFKHALRNKRKGMLSLLLYFNILRYKSLFYLCQQKSVYHHTDSLATYNYACA